MLALFTTIAVVGCSAPPAPAASSAAPGPAATGSPGVGSPAPGAGSAASALLDPRSFAAAVADPARTTINVHVPFEGAIEGTDAGIPFDRIAAEAARLPADRGTALAVYCKSGRMSAIAATTLAAMGYRDVVELRGGMEAWTRAGLPLSGTPGGGAR